jgi:hypothetical protein
MHHALQCREPDWSTIFDWDVPRRQSRGGNLSATSPAPQPIILPIHFPSPIPSPTMGRIEADGDRFHFRFIRAKETTAYPRGCVGCTALRERNRRPALVITDGATVSRTQQ